MKKTARQMIGREDIPERSEKTACTASEMLAAEVGDGNKREACAKSGESIHYKCDA